MQTSASLILCVVTICAGGQVEPIDPAAVPEVEPEKISIVLVGREQCPYTPDALRVMQSQKSWLKEEGIASRYLNLDVNPEYGKVHRVDAVPLLLFFSENDEELWRATAPQEEVKFRDLVTSVASGKKTWPEMRRQLELGNLTLEQQFELASSFEDSGQPELARLVLESISKSDLSDPDSLREVSYRLALQDGSPDAMARHLESYPQDVLARINYALASIRGEDGSLPSDKLKPFIEDTVELAATEKYPEHVVAAAYKLPHDYTIVYDLSSCDWSLPYAQMLSQLDSRDARPFQMVLVLAKLCGSVEAGEHAKVQFKDAYQMSGMDDAKRARFVQYVLELETEAIDYAASKMKPSNGN